MAMIKYSRQRESIKEFLMGRKDHPTADVIYSNLRKEYPHISLGTVYRNLSLLADLGEVQRINTEGADHFDGNISPHYHFYCRICRSILDLDLPLSEELVEEANSYFDGQVEDYVTVFRGICPGCLREL